MAVFDASRLAGNALSWLHLKTEVPVVEADGRDDLESRIRFIEGDCIVLARNSDGAGARCASTGDVSHGGLTFAELKGVVGAVGRTAKWFYLHPDLSCVKYVFSDERLPDERCLSRSLWMGRREDERETELLREALREGLFSERANAYLVLLGSIADTELPTFVKFSNLRSDIRAVETEIRRDGVWKYATVPAGFGHIKDLYENGLRLKRQYACAGIGVCGGELHGRAIRNDFVKGRSLNDILGDLYASRDESFFDLYRDYLGRLEKGNSNSYFAPSTDFSRVFGYPVLRSGLKSGTYNNIDLIFENILVSDDGAWTMIDYEWVFDFPIPWTFIAFRAIMYFFADRPDSVQRAEWQRRCHEMAGIDVPDIAAYRAMEFQLQNAIK